MIERDDGWLKRWATYLVTLQEAMNLRDWDLHLSTETSSGLEMTNTFGEGFEIAASVVPVPNRQYATVFLGEHWDEMEPEEKRHILVHELCHLPMFVVDRAFEQAIDPVQLFDFTRVSRRVMGDALEQATDAFAVMIAKHLPLPPETPPAKRKA